jgi:hypothetical protein
MSDGANETVFYKKFRKSHRFVPHEIESGTAAYLQTRPGRIEVYIPSREIEIECELRQLPCRIDYSQDDSKHRKVYDFTKNALDGPKSSWVAYNFIELPKGARSISVGTSEIDAIADGIKLLECELSLYADETRRIIQLEHDGSVEFERESMLDKRQDDFDAMCEKTFLEKIRKKPK